MATHTFSETMSRIGAASPDSPLAVFSSSEPNMYKVLFAKTAQTMGMVKLKHPNLIGVFDNTCDIIELREKLLSRTGNDIN